MQKMRTSKHTHFFVRSILQTQIKTKSPRLSSIASFIVFYHHQYYNLLDIPQSFEELLFPKKKNLLFRSSHEMSRHNNHKRHKMKNYYFFSGTFICYECLECSVLVGSEWIFCEVERIC